MADLLGVELTAEGDKLIGDNPQDKLLAKVRELRLSRKTAKNKEVLAKFSTIYIEKFLNLSKKRFDLDSELLKSGEFDKDMILALEKLIKRRALKWYYLAPILCFLTPIIGWVLVPCLYDGNCFMHKSYKFVRSRKKLEKLGKNPQEYILRALGKGTRND